VLSLRIFYAENHSRLARKRDATGQWAAQAIHTTSSCDARGVGMAQQARSSGRQVIVHFLAHRAIIRTPHWIS
jgi:hypothetical protein